MRLSKSFECKVRFARFAVEHKVDPLDLAELLTLASRAFSAGETEANTGKSADKARERFEAKAKSMGFGTSWPGLLPMLTRGGKDVYLPID